MPCIGLTPHSTAKVTNIGYTLGISNCMSCTVVRGFVSGDVGAMSCPLSKFSQSLKIFVSGSNVTNYCKTFGKKL